MSIESDLGIIVNFQDKKKLSTVARLLPKETRPDFEDNLEEWEHPLYFAIEEVDYPDEIKAINNQQLYMAWYETEEQLAELFDAFKQCGGVISLAYQCAPSGDTEELLYKYQNNKLVMIDAVGEGLKVPGDYSDKSETPRVLQTLLQGF